jgi:SAM-dependent methyltransferase
MLLSEADMAQARGILLRSNLDQLADLMFRLHFLQGAGSAKAEVRVAAEDLGWVRTGSETLTDIGWFAADVCREFVYWQKRDRKLPFADAAPDLATEALAGKSVLEIGSGSGMNLLSLVPVCREVVGLEPVGLYSQIGGLVGETLGLGQIRTETGKAEALPFEDGRFDVVFCLSSHEYFDMRPAFAEIARVLKPGGEVILISGTLGTYLLDGSRTVSALRSVKAARDYVVALLNTLGFMAIGRRVLTRPSKWTTAYPIYPTRRLMTRLLAEAGLPLHQPLRRIGTEFCFRGRKA